MGETSDSKRKPKSARANENRKLRNRLSQKAYRERQCMRIKELETKLQESQTLSENGRIIELEKQNALLKDQLLSCHKKLESLQITMQALASSTAAALGMKTNDKTCQPESDVDNHQPKSPNNDQMTLEDIASSDSYDGTVDEDLTSETFVATGIDIDRNGTTMEDTFSNSQIDMTDYGALGETSDVENDLLSLPQQMIPPPKSTCADQLHLNSLVCANPSNQMAAFENGKLFPSPMSQLPLNMSYSEMGPTAYTDLTRRGSVLVQGPNGYLRRTNSLFSDHVSVLEHFVKTKWRSRGPLLIHGNESLSSSVSFMLSVFVCMSWQTMTAWHSYTRAHIPLAKLMAWRINPTTENFSKLPLCYHPTQMQISINHPSIIDWVPWPSLRDKLIEFHSANPRLDEIICEIAYSYTCEADLSTLISDIDPVEGYVSVWDVISVISPEVSTSMFMQSLEEQRFDEYANLDYLTNRSSALDAIDEFEGHGGANCNLPAPNVQAFFSSKNFALQAFRLLGMDQGAVTFRLDPSFFERHPELYDYKASLMARGIPLRPPERKIVPLARPLDTSTLGRYRDLTKWTFDLSLQNHMSGLQAAC